MKTTQYPDKPIEQQMREKSFKVKEPTDWSKWMLIACLIFLLSSIGMVIYLAIKLHH